MQNPSAVFRKYCADNGMRFTRERQIIIEEIYRKDTHFDVDALFLRIRNLHPDIKLAKGSIYRSIPHLLRASLVRASLTADGHVCYEQTLGRSHHDHMQCVKCGKILEFYDGAIARIQKRVCMENDFEMLWHTHVIRGYCSKCRRRSAAGSGKRGKKG